MLSYPQGILTPKHKIDSHQRLLRVDKPQFHTIPTPFRNQCKKPQIIPTNPQYNPTQNRQRNPPKVDEAPIYKVNSSSNLLSKITGGQFTKSSVHTLKPILIDEFKHRKISEHQPPPPKISKQSYLNIENDLQKPARKSHRKKSDEIRMQPAAGVPPPRFLSPKMSITPLAPDLLSLKEPTFSSIAPINIQVNKTLRKQISPNRADYILESKYIKKSHQVRPTENIDPSITSKHDKTDTFSGESTNSSSKVQEIERRAVKHSSPIENVHPIKQPVKVSLDHFVVGQLIGNGQFGSVYIAKHKASGFVFALKKIDKKAAKQKQIVDQIVREIKIQSCLNHPNIIKLYTVFDDQQFVYLVLELATFGQLYKLMKQKKMSEANVAYLIKQICEAVRYLHSFKIIHRDIKPENILMEHGLIKLCDFGWAVCRGHQLRSTFCGTPLYVSPQILTRKSYDQKIDIWSLGMLSYQMLFGQIPFDINFEDQLVKIVKDQIKIPKDSHVSPQAQDFVLKLLQRDPKERWTVSQLLSHPFFNRHKDGMLHLQL